MPATTLAMGAARCGPVGVIPEGEERGHVPVGDRPDVAAMAPVTPVRPARRVLLPPEGDRPRATVAPAGADLALVDELGHGVEDKWRVASRSQR